MKKILLPSLLAFAIISCKKDELAPDAMTSVTIFKQSGLDVDWDRSGSDRIAYSMKGVDSYYDIHLANPDGSNDTCITCNHSKLPNRHIACPYFHPSGKWLLMVVEKAVHDGSSVDALPGFGAYCDIWVMSSDSTKAYKLVELINDNDHGVIAPRFSHDGTKIVWTDRKSKPNLFNALETAGFWTIKVADFKFGANGVPAISNLKTIEPIANCFYECYGFSQDDSKLIFCSDINQASFLDEHIYTIDLFGNNLTKLTTKDYNKHAFYKPDGSKIVWMTSTESGNGATDWWMMDPDGNNKQRLTYFNKSDNPQYVGHQVWAGLGAFNADGTRFVGGRQVSLITQEGEIVMVKLLR
jgi:hypothetical protein